MNASEINSASDKEPVDFIELKDYSGGTTPNDSGRSRSNDYKYCTFCMMDTNVTRTTEGKLVCGICNQEY